MRRKIAFAAMYALGAWAAWPWLNRPMPPVGVGVMPAIYAAAGWTMTTIVGLWPWLFAHPVRLLAMVPVTVWMLGVLMRAGRPCTTV